MSNSISDDLRLLANEQRAAVTSRYFKTQKGEYGENQICIGVSVPECRNIAKAHTHASWEELTMLLTSSIHEERLTAALILVEKYKDKTMREACVQFYISHIKQLFNWDVVDLSCYKILGKWLLNKDKSLLYSLAKSDNLWEQRTAMVTCLEFIRNNQFDDAFRIAELLLPHPHDLIHKAVGWMLREIGKRDEQRLLEFLHSHYKKMARTTLRYAIEKLEPSHRMAYLKGNI